VWDKHPLFLDYLHIRQRIESRMASSQAILTHIGLFLIAVLALLITTLYPINYPYVPRSHFIDAGASYLMTVWSIALLGHGVWVYRKSGASANTRARAVENEINQRLEHEDTELFDNPRQVFRLQAVLNEDIRLRAGLFTPITLFLMLNAVTWAAWAVQGASTSYTWQMTIPTALVILLPPLAVNTWRRNRRNRRIMRLLTNEYAVSEKPKRTAEDARDAVYRLSDDGELVQIVEEDEPLAMRKARD
jgi:Na+/melibiose symporter-like transporter